jgi:hypothetical protein
MHAMVFSHVKGSLKWTEFDDRRPGRTKFASRSPPAAFAGRICMFWTEHCPTPCSRLFQDTKSSVGSMPSARASRALNWVKGWAYPGLVTRMASAPIA